MKNVLTALFLLCFILPTPAEMILGGEASSSLGSFVDPENPMDSSLEGTLGFTPRIVAYGESFSFEVRGSLVWDLKKGEYSYGLDSFLLEKPLGDYQILKIGRFLYKPEGEFFGCAAFFTQTDLVELLKTGGRGGQSAVDILQWGVFTSNPYFLLTLAPFASDPALPDLDSPWFPRGSLPEEVSYTLIGTTFTHPLGDLSYSVAEAETEIENISIGIEAGWYWGLIQFMLFGYHGWDNDPLTTVTFDVGDLFSSDPFDLIINPIQRRITALGWGCTGGTGGLRLWHQGAFTFNKTFTTGRLDTSGGDFTTATAEAPYLELLGGFSYEWESPCLVLLGEGVYGWGFPGDETDINPLPLERAAAATLFLSLLDYRFIPSLTVLTSLEDRSTGGMARLTFAPSDAMELSLWTLLFFGPGDSEMGQYNNNRMIQIDLSWRY